MIRTIVFIGTAILLYSCSPKISESAASGGTASSSSVSSASANAPAQAAQTGSTSMEVKGELKDIVPASAPAEVK